MQQTARTPQMNRHVYELNTCDKKNKPKTRLISETSNTHLVTQRYTQNLAASTFVHLVDSTTQRNLVDFHKKCALAPQQNKKKAETVKTLGRYMFWFESNWFWVSFPESKFGTHIQW